MDIKKRKKIHTSLERGIKRASRELDNIFGTSFTSLDEMEANANAFILKKYRRPILC